MVEIIEIESEILLLFDEATQIVFFLLFRRTREYNLRESIPHTWVCSNDNFLKSIYRCESYVLSLSDYTFLAAALIVEFNLDKF